MKLFSTFLFLLVILMTARGERLEFPPLLDLEGKVVHLGQNDQQHKKIFVFLTTECPIARSYLPTLNRLHKKFHPGGTRLFGVWSDTSVTRKDATKHFKEFGVTSSVLHDNGGLLANILTPTHVPEAFLISLKGELSYREAIDNTWKEIGHRRPEAEKHYLVDALEVVLDGKTPPLKQAPAVGCLIEDSPLPGEGPTFTRDIAPLIFTRDIAPDRPRPSRSPATPRLASAPGRSPASPENALCFTGSPKADTKNLWANGGWGTMKFPSFKNGPRPVLRKAIRPTCHLFPNSRKVGSLDDRISS